MDDCEVWILTVPGAKGDTMYSLWGGPPTQDRHPFALNDQSMRLTLANILFLAGE